MTNSDTSSSEMQKARDYSFGYDYNPSTKVTRRLPQREIPAAAPAGAINSSARDMAQWVRLMLNNGKYNGKQLSFRKGLRRTGPHANEDRRSRWLRSRLVLARLERSQSRRARRQHRRVQSQVALMPDQKLGFVLLTNVTGSSLGAYAMNTIWKNLVGDPNAAEAEEFRTGG